MQRDKRKPIKLLWFLPPVRHLVPRPHRRLFSSAFHYSRSSHATDGQKHACNTHPAPFFNIWTLWSSFTVKVCPASPRWFLPLPLPRLLLLHMGGRWLMRRDKAPALNIKHHLSPGPTLMRAEWHEEWRFGGSFCWRGWENKKQSCFHVHLAYARSRQPQSFMFN